MAIKHEPINARSGLFAPGDSEKKMGKALASPADIVLFDLEDAVAPEHKQLARRMVHDFIAANATANENARARLWLRIIPSCGDPDTLGDLAAIMPARPGDGLVDLVEAGAVTNARSEVDVIVTEFGAAELKGQTLAERSRRLIAIAQPDFREDLARVAHKIKQRGY